MRPRQFALRTWAWLNALFEEPQFVELVGLMSILSVMLHLTAGRRLRELIFIVCVAGILDRRWLQRSGFWLMLTALLVVNHVLQWDVLDNHKYLQTYWCLAVGISCLLPSRAVGMAVNARWLIALCFLFATVTKLLSAEFLDGSFFHFTLLTDRRFSGFADLVGGVPATVSVANNATLQTLLAPYGSLDVVRLEDAPRIGSLAAVLTLWTLLIEGAIALVFLLPDRFRAAALRDPLLILFVLTAYPIATVVGFGRVLVVMGLAQTRDRAGVARAMYLACFVLLPLLEFPFVRAVRMLLD